MNLGKFLRDLLHRVRLVESNPDDRILTALCKPAVRLFELAERFKLPVLSFVDTTAAYPGVPERIELVGELVVGRENADVTVSDLSAVAEAEQAMSDGARESMIRGMVDRLAATGDVDGDHYLHATRGELLHRLGQSDEVPDRPRDDISRAA